MTGGVLADTGPLDAAVDPDDGHHARAQRQLGELAQAKLHVAVLHSTLAEAYSLVMYRLGPSKARVWLDEVSAGAVLLGPTDDNHLEARGTLSTFADQPLSLFDALLAAASRRMHAPVWAYDHHFDLLRVDVWRGAA